MSKRKPRIEKRPLEFRKIHHGREGWERAVAGFAKAAEFSLEDAIRRMESLAGRVLKEAADRVVEEYAETLLTRALDLRNGLQEAADLEDLALRALHAGVAWERLRAHVESPWLN